MTIHAMILAAGRGERMRPLTDNIPKPLLHVGGKTLLDWHVDALARGGFTRLVINTAWLGAQIPAHFANRDGAPSAAKLARSTPDTATVSSPTRCTIAYSHEGDDFGEALETAGGIARALPMLGDVFWVLAGDVFMPEFEFSAAAVDRFIGGRHLAHLWLVPNPAHNPQGDFGISDTGLALNLPAASPGTRHTFSTVALYRRAFFEALPDLPAGNPDGVKAPLAPLLRAAMDNQRVSAELYTGPWTDVGTPARLLELNQSFSHDHEASCP